MWQWQWQWRWWWWRWWVALAVVANTVVCSSITIDDVVFVINSGRVKQVRRRYHSTAPFTSNA